MKFVKKIIKRALFLKPADPKNALLRDYVECPDSTVLLDGLNIRFDVGKEKRVYVQIGERGLIRGQFIFESSAGFVKIGNNVHIGGATFISRSSIIVEDDVTMAWGITIYDHNSHSIYWEFRKNDNHQCYHDYFKHNGNNVVNKDWSKVVTKPIKICSKVWIGFDVTILKGVTIGEGAVIGAKSVVTKDIPAWTVVAGNPARVIKELTPLNNKPYNDYRQQ
jgi:acetyltransferase-like isoleucine patch superfamily enzyme